MTTIYQLLLSDAAAAVNLWFRWLLSPGQPRFYFCRELCKSLVVQERASSQRSLWDHL